MVLHDIHKEDASRTISTFSVIVVVVVVVIITTTTTNTLQHLNHLNDTIFFFSGLCPSSNFLMKHDVSEGDSASIIRQGSI
jgi:hypothetical protein